MNEESENLELKSPEDLGVQVASMLLEEVAQGGVVDSAHQVWSLKQTFSLLFEPLTIIIFCGILYMLL